LREHCENRCELHKSRENGSKRADNVAVHA
jgi:hypothetical protein